MTALNETEQLVFKLERLHAEQQRELEGSLTRARELADSLTLTVEIQQKTITIQRNTIDLQEAVMAQQEQQIQRIKPTLFGAYIGGLVSGAILATVIGAYILWVQG